MTELLAALLRGDRLPARVLAEVDPEVFLRAARHHAVVSLAADRLAAQEYVPLALRVRLRDEARREVVNDLVRETELQACLDALGTGGAPAILMKGAQLAYSHYARPDLRPRDDSDLLIGAGSHRAVDRLLRDLGYGKPQHVTGELVMSQATYVKRQDGIVRHAVDVHWRIANPHVFGEYLSYQEAARTAVPIPQLGPSALGLSDVHALLVACVHRIAHHYDSDRLIWLYDVHLIASRLNARDWECFVQLAEAKGVATVCRQSLERTTLAFGTSVTLPDRAGAAANGSANVEDATSAYLVRHRRHIQDVVADLRALPTWSDRLRLAREHLIPPMEYMREVYAPSSGAPLPVLYAQRALRGMRKWLSRSE